MIIKCSRIIHVFILCITICFAVLFTISCKRGKIPPVASGGVIDLRDWDLVRDGPVELNGQWEFYWARHLNPDRNNPGELPPFDAHIVVPGVWNGLVVNGKKITGQGFATYRLKILWNPVRHPAGLKLNTIATAYNLYVNGERVAGIGVPGSTAESTVPRYYPLVEEIPDGKDVLDVVIQVSNFHYTKGGVWMPILFGDATSIYTERERQVLFEYFLLGGVLIMGLYHLILYFLRRRDRSPLYFSLLCCAIVLRILCTGEYHITRIIPGIGLEPVVKIEYLSYYLGSMVFAVYMRSIFFNEYSARFLRGLQIATAVFAIPVILGPSLFYTRFVMGFHAVTLGMCAYTVYVLTRAIVNKREGGIVFLAGCLVVIAAVVNDIIFSQQIIYTGLYAPAGIFVFFLSQSVVLSLRFSRAFISAENLTAELDELNRNLEGKVQERTSMLNDANEFLVRTNREVNEAYNRLRISEEKYSTILATINDGYFEVNQKGDITACNEAFYRMFGLTREEILTMNYSDYMGREDAEKVYQSFNQVYRTGEPSEVFEYRFSRKSGELCIAEASTSLIVNSEGKKIGFRGILRDMTEKKAAEEALRRNEEKYREIVENASELIYRIDLSGMMMFLNPATLRFSGYSLGEALKKNFLDFIPAGHKDTVLRFFQDQVKKRIETTYFEHPLIKKDGSVAWIGTNVTFGKNHEGKPEFSGIARDITELKRAEMALRESEEQYRELIDNVTDTIYKSDWKGNFNYINPVGVKVTGFSVDEILKMNYVDLIHPDSRDEVFQFYSRQLREKSKESYYEFKIRCKDGRIIWLGQRTRLVEGDDGTIEFFNIARDITEKKKSEESLRELDRQKSNFFANVSHEIRTPLTLILSPIESAIQGDYGDRVGLDFLRNIHRNAIRLLKLINNLLDFSKIDAGRMTLIIKETDIVEFITRYVAAVRSTADSRGIALSFETSLKSLDLCIDREKMDKIFMNLFSNAIKFTGKEGSIVIRLRDAGGYCRVDFEDSGNGIPPEKIGVIFDRFGQAETGATRTYEGTGIGLALVKEFVEIHRGKIDVVSRHINDHPGDHGTIFTVSIPKGRAHLENRGDVEFITDDEVFDSITDRRFSGMREMDDLAVVGRGDPSGGNAAGPAANPGARTVLIVDDNPDMRNFIGSLLSQEYAVFFAVNGKEGLDLARRRRPDIILTDVMMPEMNGYEMTGILKGDPELKLIPIIMLTARAEITHKIEGIEYGADDYLTKPFNSRELFARITALLNVYDYQRLIAARNSEMEDELEMARAVMSRLLQESMPSVPGYEIHTVYQPMETVGGDFYHVGEREGSLELMIADVSGHGLHGALVSLITTMAFERIPGRDSVGMVMTLLNEVAWRTSVRGSFVTSFFGSINRDSRVIRFSNAGHPPPLVYRRATGEFHSLNARGTALGWFPEIVFEVGTFALLPGDRMVLYTDGIIECVNPGNELFGDDRFRDLIRACADLGPVDFSGRLLKELEKFAESQQYGDDLTMLVLDIE